MHRKVGMEVTLPHRGLEDFLAGFVCDRKLWPAVVVDFQRGRCALLLSTSLSLAIHLTLQDAPSILLQIVDDGFVPVGIELFERWCVEVGQIARVVSVMPGINKTK